MKGICFKENLFNQIVFGNKTQTRRIANGTPKYKQGDVLFLKEPYQFNYHLVQKDILYEATQNDVVYKYINQTSTSQMLEEKWKNKLFMPSKFARFFIKITAVREEKLHDISNEDAIKEGIEMARFTSNSYRNYLNYLLCFAKDKMYKVDESFKNEYSGAVMSFLTLWQKINGGNVLDINPVVYVYSFELTTQP